MRGERRRRELLDAATRVAGREGRAGISARAVATEAGVSPGSVIYHFGDMDGLVTAALTAVLERFADERRALIVDIDDPVERLRTLIDHGVPDRVDGALRFVYEQVGHLRERPESAALHRSVVERQVDLYEATIELGARLGVFRPRLASRSIAQTLVALEDAFDLYALVGFEGRAPAYRQHMRDVAASLLDVEI